MLSNLNLMNSDISQYLEFQIQSGRQKHAQNCINLRGKILLNYTHLFQNINIPKSRAFTLRIINRIKHTP